MSNLVSAAADSRFVPFTVTVERPASTRCEHCGESLFADHFLVPFGGQWVCRAIRDRARQVAAAVRADR